MPLPTPIRYAIPLTAVAILYAFPPATTPYYPRCPIHDLTGFLCPGCGATRALAFLLHADWLQAWHANPLIVVLLPMALAYLITAQTKKKWPPIPPSLIAALLMVTTLFTIARNLST